MNRWLRERKHKFWADKLNHELVCLMAKNLILKFEFGISRSQQLAVAKLNKNFWHLYYVFLFQLINVIF